jgi:tetratricopeptide (TPR) repeat protein
MESDRQLDLVGDSGRNPKRKWSAILSFAILSLKMVIVLSCASLTCHAQTSPPEADLARIKQLYTEQRWPEIVSAIAQIPAPDAELEYYDGIALAQLGRLDEGRKSLLAGRRLLPTDKRFPIELAGVAFKQKHYPAAAAWLRRGLRIDPNDSYANDFLGTIYFLEGNLEAALKYWNRVAKPELENVEPDQEFRIKPALLDRAFTFSPGSQLQLSDLWTSEARIQGLEVFSNHNFQLSARDDGKFDLTLNAQEKNGWGENKWQSVLSTFRGVFYQTAYPDYFNLNGSATNITSLVRWDAQKRRLLAAVSGPLRQNPKWRYRVALDLRSENWDIRDSFEGPSPLLGALRLRRESVSADIASFNSGRWAWSTGFELSDRGYDNVFSGSVLTPGLLLDGLQLKALAQVHHELWSVPERRFTTSAALSGQLGRIWSSASSHEVFAKTQGSFEAHWLPQSHRDDFETRERIGAGEISGQVSFDELYILGMERDNDLWLRAHIGTRDGRKGSAPLGRRYFLSNTEMDKKIYDNGLFSVKVGPFLDNGKITDSTPGLGARKWLWDTGAEAKLHVLGVGVRVIYGKDLRSGNNAFYVTAER